MYRKEKEYEEWRNSILKRDNHICQLCGANENERILHVHHIIKYSEDETLRTDENNGITLCNICHQQIFNKEKEYEQIFIEILKNPIWKRKEIIEIDEDIKYKNYNELNKNESILCLTDTAIKYIKDVYAFKVYCYLCSEFNYDLNCTKTTFETIAEDCSIARSTVQKAIKYLEERGFIVKLQKQNLKQKSNCYHIKYVIKEEKINKENSNK